MGIECREDDNQMISLLQCLEHRPTTLRCLCERAFLRTLQGGCQVPIAVHSEYSDNILRLFGEVDALDGSVSISDQAQIFISVDDDCREMCHEKSEQLGIELAKKLIHHGAVSIIGDMTSKRPITYGNPEGKK